MKYQSGEDAKVGDKVRLSDGVEGVVVCSIDADEYTSDYPKTQWSYLKRGILIDFEKYGLIHYEMPDPEIELIGHIL